MLRRRLGEEGECTVLARRVALACTGGRLRRIAGCAHYAPFIAEPTDSKPPAAAAIDHRLILIGDAGDPDPDGEPTLPRSSSR